MFTKDDDHMAQIIELMGDFSVDAKMGGKYSRELFDATGEFCVVGSPLPYTYMLSRRSSVYPYTQALAVKAGDDGEVPLYRRRCHSAVRLFGTDACSRYERSQGC